MAVPPNLYHLFPVQHWPSSDDFGTYFHDYRRVHNKEVYTAKSIQLFVVLNVELTEHFQPLILVFLEPDLRQLAVTLMTHFTTNSSGD